MPSPVYDIWTSAPESVISEVSLELFRQWVEFALGMQRLGGRLLVHPTGRYAASLSMRSTPGHVAILADESLAPEALFLETGHGRVDLKTKMRPGVIPMARGGGQIARVRPRTAAARTGAMKPSLWATRRANEGTGFATLSPNSPAGSWIIPPMPAYRPGWHLAQEAVALLRSGGYSASM